MRDGTVVLFGAGATKACGGPLTAEILPRAFANWGLIEREDFMAELEAFLTDNFHLPSDRDAWQDRESYPPLPLLIGLSTLRWTADTASAPDGISTAWLSCAAPWTT